MKLSWMRTAAISCLLTCGAVVAGPGIAGGAVASADLLGIDLDIFDIFCHNDKKCDHDNHRRGVPGVGSNVPEVRINGISKYQSAAFQVRLAVAASPAAAARTGRRTCRRCRPRQVRAKS